MKKRKLRPTYADIILAAIVATTLNVLCVYAAHSHELEIRNHKVERISGGGIQAAGVDLYKKRPDDPPEREHPLKKEFPEIFATEAVVVSFGADWCTFCPAQARNLRIPSERYNILYVKVDEIDEKGERVKTRWGRLMEVLELGDTMPLTVVIEKGEVTKTFIGLTRWATIRPSAEKAKKTDDDEEGTIIIGPIRIDWGPDDVDVDLNRHRRT